MQDDNNHHIAIESHLRAIEDAVQVANLDGGCNFADHIMYHIQQVRELRDKEEIKNEKT